MDGKKTCKHIAHLLGLKCPKCGRTSRSRIKGKLKPFILICVNGRERGSETTLLSLVASKGLKASIS